MTATVTSPPRVPSAQAAADGASTAGNPDGGTPVQPVPEEPGLNRVLTAPNVITMVRLACVPIFVWLLFGAHRQTGAAALLAVLGATDWVDGFVARRYHQVSTLGKILDPVADRVLMATAVISIMVYGAVPLWFGWATIVREVLVAGTVVLLAAFGARRIDVLWLGKAGTFGLMFAYPAFLLSYGSADWQVPFRVFAWGSGIIGLTLAWIAAVAYLAPARKALAEGRAARRARRDGTGGGTARRPRSAGEVGA